MKFRTSTLLWATLVLALGILAARLQWSDFEQKQKLAKLRNAAEKIGYFDQDPDDCVLARTFECHYSARFDSSVAYRIRLPEMNGARICWYYGAIPTTGVPPTRCREQIRGSGPGSILFFGASNLVSPNDLKVWYTVLSESQPDNLTKLQRGHMNTVIPEITKNHTIDAPLQPLGVVTRYQLGDPIILRKEYFTDDDGTTDGYMIWLETPSIVGTPTTPPPSAIKQ